MDTFSVVKEPTPSLRERSQEVEVSQIQTPEFQNFLDKLTRTMLVEDGVGIASPQVGNNIRAIVVNLPTGPECFMNPEITKKSETMVDSDEGCLSVPEKYGVVQRHKKVTLRALNRHGRRIEFEAKAFPAIIFQHEIDHLDGVLFIDKAKNIVKLSNGKHI